MITRTMKVIHRDSLSCEPILRRMPDQDLLCVAQCGDVREPAPGNRVYSFRSTDDGQTWSRPALLYPETGQAVYVTEVMVLNNQVYAFLTIHNGRFLNMNCTVMESSDSGRTWRESGALPHFPAFCFIRGMIRSANGNVILPYQYYPVSNEENARLIIASHNILDYMKQKSIFDANIDHVENGVLISEDDGKTYNRHAGPFITIKGTTGRRWAWTEPTIVALPGNRLAMLLRVCGSGRLWRSDSNDGGRTWTEAVMTDIPNPANKPKLIGLPDGRIALIHTPNNQCGFEYRNPLSIWVSENQMADWQHKHIVTDFPGAFCYPDGIFEADHQHIIFTIEYNRHDILYIECVL